MDNRGVIDENSQEVPYKDGDAHNIQISFVENEPHIQLVQFIQKTGDHIDIFAIASDLNLNSIGNLEYLGKLIAEKVSEYRNREP